MKYGIFRTNAFKKSFKKLSSKDREKVLDVVERLANDETLEPRFHDHPLSGNWKECRECHVKPDLLLVYRIREEVLELALVEVGSHSELFS